MQDRTAQKLRDAEQDGLRAKTGDETKIRQKVEDGQQRKQEMKQK